MQELARRIGKDQSTAARYVVECGFELVPGWDGNPHCSKEAAAFVVQAEDKAQADGDLRHRLYTDYQAGRKEEQKRIFDTAYAEAHEVARKQAIKQITASGTGIIGRYSGGPREHSYAQAHALKVLAEWLAKNPMKDSDEVFDEYNRR